MKFYKEIEIKSDLEKIKRNYKKVKKLIGNKKIDGYEQLGCVTYLCRKYWPTTFDEFISKYTNDYTDIINIRGIDFDEYKPCSYSGSYERGRSIEQLEGLAYYIYHSFSNRKNLLTLEEVIDFLNFKLYTLYITAEVQNLVEHMLQARGFQTFYSIYGDMNGVDVFATKDDKKFLVQIKSINSLTILSKSQVDKIQKRFDDGRYCYILYKYDDLLNDVLNFYTIGDNLLVFPEEIFNNGKVVIPTKTSKPEELVRVLMNDNKEAEVYKNEIIKDDEPNKAPTEKASNRNSTYNKYSAFLKKCGYKLDPKDINFVTDREGNKFIFTEIDDSNECFAGLIATKQKGKNDFKIRSNAEYDGAVGVMCKDGNFSLYVLQSKDFTPIINKSTQVKKIIDVVNNRRNKDNRYYPDKINSDFNNINVSDIFGFSIPNIGISKMSDVFTKNGQKLKFKCYGNHNGSYRIGLTVDIDKMKKIH